MFLRNSVQIRGSNDGTFGTRRGVHAALLGARMAELRQGFVEVVGQERHAEEI